RIARHRWGPTSRRLEVGDPPPFFGRSQEVDPGLPEVEPFGLFGDEPRHLHHIGETELVAETPQVVGRITLACNDQSGLDASLAETRQRPQDQIDTLVLFEPAQIEECRFIVARLSRVGAVEVEVDAVRDNYYRFPGQPPRDQIVRRA